MVVHYAHFTAFVKKSGFFSLPSSKIIERIFQLCGSISCLSPQTISQKRRSSTQLNELVNFLLTCTFFGVLGMVSNFTPIASCLHNHLKALFSQALLQQTYLTLTPKVPPKFLKRHIIKSFISDFLLNKSSTKKSLFFTTHD